MSNITTRPSIIRLLTRCGPFAVFGTIAQVVIYPLQRMFRRWSRTHVSQEVCEGVTPVVTYRNAAATVVTEACIVRVITTVFHGLPRAVFRRTRHVVACVSTSAATRSCMPSSKLCSRHSGHCATFATAEPVHHPVHLGEFDDRQFPVDISTLIFDVAGQSSRIARSHLTLLGRDMVVRAACGQHPARGLFHCITGSFIL